LGGQAEEVLGNYPELVGILDGSAGDRREFCFESADACWIQVSISPVIDTRRNLKLGRLIWFHDITEERPARARMLDQQRTMAALKEGELLARELHDGVGQMVAATHLHHLAWSVLLM
jgi:signal transduction histidine kinase